MPPAIRRPLSSSMSSSGFTLVEMAVVLIVVAILMGGMMAGLSSQYDARAQAETEQILSDIREALLGFAASQQRLPCPATAAQGNGSEAFATGGTAANGACSSFHGGFVPGTTLGLSPTDAQGFVLDGWNQRIRYALTSANSNAFAASGQMRTVGMTTLAPNLMVCSSLNGGTCATNATLTSNAVAVVYSTGRNWPTNGTTGHTEEAANTNGDPVFVSHAPSPSSVSGGEFDDLVIWLSPYVLYNRMISAGVLP